MCSISKFVDILNLIEYIDLIKIPNLYVGLCMQYKQQYLISNQKEMAVTSKLNFSFKLSIGTCPFVQQQMILSIKSIHHIFFLSSYTSPFYYQSVNHPTSHTIHLFNFFWSYFSFTLCLFCYKKISHTKFSVRPNSGGNVCD